MSRSASVRFSQARISSIFDRTKWARLGLSFGSIGGLLKRKLVKPTKVFCSCAAHQPGFGQVSSPQTETYIWTSGARVLGEANAAVRQEFGCLDSLNGVLNQAPEFFALFIANGGSEVLNLNQAF